MGARPLRRAIQRFIEDPLADEVLKAPMAPGSTVLVERDPARDKSKDGSLDEELKITILPPVDKGPADEPVPVGGGDEGPEPSGEPDEPQPEQPAES
jgi:ATP-dependent Clp protease ATP-binding subunit ClpC